MLYQGDCQELIFSNTKILTPSPFLESDSSESVIANQNHKQFKFGGTPILSFDPDLGLKYGLVLNIFERGIHCKEDDYDQYHKIRAFNSTKGTSNLSLLFESSTLIKNIDLIMEAS